MTLTPRQRKLAAMRLASKQKVSGVERVKQDLFKQQIDFLADPEQFKAALCTRRAGKSHLAAAALFMANELHPGSVSVYIALTRRSAKNIMWSTLKQLNRKYELGYSFNASELTATAPNGSQIMLYGANMENFIDTLRGNKYAIAVIDEAQGFRYHISTLVDDVLTPALVDYNGQLLLLGTPGPIPAGLFYDATVKNIGYSVHKWSIRDNPHIPHAATFIESYMKRKGWTENNPTYLREWCGKWVEDRDALVYKFDPTINKYSDLPEGFVWNCILGIDYGYNDATAFSVVAYCDQSPVTYVRHIEGHAKMIPSKIADRLLELIDIYKPFRIVADTGGLGKSITEEMIQRYHIPIKAAEKTEKMTFISLLNGDFIDKRLFVHRDLVELEDQYLTLTYNDKYKEDPSLPNDLCDATLYAYREARAYCFQEVVREPERGTREYYDKIAQEMEEAEMEAFKREEEREWFDK